VNGNEIVTTHLGSSYAVDEIQERIVRMMPGAQEAPADVVWAAAQLAVAHRLNPFNGEMYILKLGRKEVTTPGGTEWVDDYRPYVGVKGLRRKARERSNFMTEFREMEPDEVKLARGKAYDPEDVGVECRMYRLDAAYQAKMAGLEYLPTQASGYWRRKANYNRKKNEWMPDSIPATWTAVMVAKKRAEVNALKEAFDLTIDIADPSLTGEFGTAEVLAQTMEAFDRDTALPMERQLVREPDGNVLLATSQTPKRRRAAAAVAEQVEDVGFYTYDEAGNLDGEVEGEVVEEEEAGERYAPQDIDYAEVIAAATGRTKSLIEWGRTKHAQSGGPATDAQYKYLAGVIDALTGVLGSHRAVLEVMTGREVRLENPPGFDLAKRLLDFLVVKRKDPDTGEVIRNVNYRADIASTLQVVWNLCMEAEGQLKLFE
jgi:hypothetical protein